MGQAREKYAGMMTDMRTGGMADEEIQSLKDQATKEGQSMEGIDDEQTRRKVESTLERRMVYDFLAEAAELEAEYVDGEEEFDEALMEKLAAESVERQEAAEAAEKATETEEA